MGKEQENMESDKGSNKSKRKAKWDITGQRWGRLVAVKQVGYTEKNKNGKRQALWLWRCDCGNEKVIRATDVKHAGTRSCGCLSTEHASTMKKENIAGKRFGRLVAVQPTEERDGKGNVIWELKCDCGNTLYKTVNALKTGRVLSCGCLYKESRAEVSKYRKDFVENTSLSAIVISKKARSNSTSGHTGVWFNTRTGRWEAYINYQKKRFHLGCYVKKEEAVYARKVAEQKLHDPIVIEYWEHLTEERRKEFAAYLRENNKKSS